MTTTKKNRSEPILVLFSTCIIIVLSLEIYDQITTHRRVVLLQIAIGINLLTVIHVEVKPTAGE